MTVKPAAANAVLLSESDYDTELRLFPEQHVHSCNAELLTLASQTFREHAQIEAPIAARSGAGVVPSDPPFAVPTAAAAHRVSEQHAAKSIPFSTARSREQSLVDMLGRAGVHALHSNACAQGMQSAFVPHLAFDSLSACFEPAPTSAADAHALSLGSSAVWRVPDADQAWPPAPASSVSEATCATAPSRTASGARGSAAGRATDQQQQGSDQHASSGRSGSRRPAQRAQGDSAPLQHALDKRAEAFTSEKQIQSSSLEQSTGTESRSSASGSSKPAPMVSTLNLDDALRQALNPAQPPAHQRGAGRTIASSRRFVHTLRRAQSDKLPAQTSSVRGASEALQEPREQRPRAADAFGVASAGSLPPALSSMADIQDARRPDASRALLDLLWRRSTQARSGMHGASSAHAAQPQCKGSHGAVHVAAGAHLDGYGPDTISSRIARAQSQRSRVQRSLNVQSARQAVPQQLGPPGSHMAESVRLGSGLQHSADSAAPERLAPDMVAQSAEAGWEALAHCAEIMSTGQGHCPQLAHRIAVEIGIAVFVQQFQILGCCCCALRALDNHVAVPLQDVHV